MNVIYLYSIIFYFIYKTKKKNSKSNISKMDLLIIYTIDYKIF